MHTRVDPRRREVEALKQAASWRLSRVLDVGCGEGRLTVRLARLGAVVTAIDPAESSVRKARESLPKRLATRVRFRVGKAENLAFQDQSFDRVVYSWSL
jgi:ubiquinone/menaquinone biosynthesis C-methylase UbiE